MIICRALAGWMSPAGTGGALSVLIFHRVVREFDPLFPEEPDADRFDRVLTWLGRSFTVLPLGRAIEHLRGGTLPARAVSITFDDGYEDNASVALPVLLSHRMNATFFIASGFLDGGTMWNDRVIEAVRQYARPLIDLEALGFGRLPAATYGEKRKAIDHLLGALKYLAPQERLDKADRIADRLGSVAGNALMMTTSQIKALHGAGMDIGGHTRNHPILARLDDRQARAEIADDKAALEAIIGQPISLFAYPNGKPERDYRRVHVDMVKAAGYEAAMSTSVGAAQAGADLFQLPRFTPWDRSELRFGVRLVNNMRSAGKVAA